MSVVVIKLHFIRYAPHRYVTSVCIAFNRLINSNPIARELITYAGSAINLCMCSFMAIDKFTFENRCLAKSNRSAFSDRWRRESAHCWAHRSQEDAECLISVGSFVVERHQRTESLLTNCLIQLNEEQFALTLNNEYVTRIVSSFLPSSILPMIPH